MGNHTQVRFACRIAELSTKTGGSAIAVSPPMRLARALLLAGLFGGLTAVAAPAALADEAKPADPKPEVAKVEGGKKVPLRVVRMLPETHQVLLYDRNRGTHVAAEVGQEIDGYIVDEIDGDEVTLVAPSGAEVILTAPDLSWRRRAAERKAAKASKATETAAPAPETAATPHELGPVDPYADAPAPATPSTPAPTSAAAPLTAGEGGVRVASATPGATTVVPADPYADVSPGITAFADAVGAPAPATAAPAPASKAAPTDAKVDAAAGLAAAATGTPAVAAPAPVIPAAPAAPTFTVTRREVDAALADFGATAVTFDAAFVTGGLRFDHIAKGTILGKLGLQDGDVLSSVDNQPVRSLDDAASLSARAGTAKAATLYIVRGGKPVALKVTIK